MDIQLAEPGNKVVLLEVRLPQHYNDNKVTGIGYRESPYELMLAHLSREVRRVCCFFAKENYDLFCYMFEPFREGKDTDELGEAIENHLDRIFQEIHGNNADELQSLLDEEIEKNASLQDLIEFIKDERIQSAKDSPVVETPKLEDELPEKCEENRCWYVVPENLEQASEPYTCRICGWLHTDRDSMRTLDKEGIDKQIINSQKAASRMNEQPDEGDKFEKAMKKYRMMDIENDDQRKSLSPHYKSKKGEYENAERFSNADDERRRRIRSLC